MCYTLHRGCTSESIASRTTTTTTTSSMCSPSVTARDLRLQNGRPDTKPKNPTSWVQFNALGHYITCYRDSKILTFQNIFNFSITISLLLIFVHKSNLLISFTTFLSKILLVCQLPFVCHLNGWVVHMKTCEQSIWGWVYTSKHSRWLFDISLCCCQRWDEYKACRQIMLC